MAPGSNSPPRTFVPVPIMASTFLSSGYAAKSPGCFRSQKEYYKGKIVVLGSSRAETMDHAQTPIGVMSGSELILNATRAFLEFKPLEQSPPFTMLMDKFKGIGIAMIPMFITWSLIFASEPITQKIRGNLINRFRNSRIKLLRFCHWQILNWFRMLFVIAIFINFSSRSLSY